MERKAEWADWARTETVLQISGRYEGRFAKRFRMFRLPAAFAPARTASLPGDIRSGQRLSVTGKLRKSGSLLIVEATRIVIGQRDTERMVAAAQKLTAKPPDETYQLLTEYRRIADFYSDDALKSEIAAVRDDTFRRERSAGRGNANALLKLADRGKIMSVATKVVQAVRFEALIAIHAAKPGQPVDRRQLLDRIRTDLPGWDKHNTTNNSGESNFWKSPAAEYNAAGDADRVLMHRWFYRRIRLAELLQMLADDGSNAGEVAEVIAAELPEEAARIAELKTQYVDYRISTVKRLTRQQLGDLEILLIESQRKDEFNAVLDDWVSAQDSRLNNGQLDGLIATAGEYLFVFERWKRPEHNVAATRLLKRAWESAQKAAPKEAGEIQNQLEQLGWTRMHDRWMTTDEVANLPKSDIELAMREGRVVKGMSPSQVLGTLGEPNRRVRVVSRRHVQEIWIYGDSGSTTITVHLQRENSTSPDEAVATLIGRSAD